MSRPDPHPDVVGLFRSSMPARQEGAPLFRTPWHARIFALMVMLVGDRRLEWKTFQERLVAELKAHRSADADLTAEEVDLQYFDCWLAASEKTLLEAGFLTGSDIGDRIGRIGADVAEVRRRQLDPRHHRGEG